MHKYLPGRPRPVNPPDLYIERARDAEGYYVLRGEHGWLHGTKSAAIDDLFELTRIERWRE